MTRICQSLSHARTSHAPYAALSTPNMGGACFSKPRAAAAGGPGAAGVDAAPQSSCFKPRGQLASAEGRAEQYEAAEEQVGTASYRSQLTREQSGGAFSYLGPSSHDMPATYATFLPQAKVWSLGKQSRVRTSRGSECILNMHVVHTAASTEARTTPHCKRRSSSLFRYSVRGRIYFGLSPPA